MSKKVSLFSRSFFLAIISASFLQSCSSDLDLSSYTQEKSCIVNIVNQKLQTPTTDYLGKSFYLSGIDGVQSLVSTRAAVSTKKLTRSFEINADCEQDKYLGVHVMPACVNDEYNLQKIEVWVNGIYVDDLNLISNEWQFATLKNDCNIHLVPGTNTITFASEIPYYPEIDAIQVENETNALIKEDPMYKDFLTKVSHLLNFLS